VPYVLDAHQCFAPAPDPPRAYTYAKRFGGGEIYDRFGATIESIMMPAGKRIHVLVWSERTEPAAVYPAGINGAVGWFLQKDLALQVKAANITDPDLGVSEAVLDETDVLIWYGHLKHAKVPAAVIKRIVTHVKEKGMGYLPLHSSHFALPFKAVLNEIAPVKDVGAWRAYINDGKPTQISVTDPAHPIAKGVTGFTIPETERYDEPFQVPGPETVVFGGTYADGQHARQGLCWTIGKGRVFYFRPGHEEYPIFFQPEVQKIVTNAVHWLAGPATGE
jgi:trehalose utilization protein